MMLGAELKRWVNQLADADEIAIDEGGLALVVKNSGAYCEIGGIPLCLDAGGIRAIFEGEADPLEPGWRNAGE